MKAKFSKEDLKKKECVDLYNSKVSSKYKDIFNVIVKNTQFYTKNDILTSLRDNLIKWKNKRSNLPLFVLLPEYQEESRLFFYNKVKKYLPKHVRVNEFRTHTEEVEYLFLDDWILNFSKLKEDLSEANINIPILVENNKGKLKVKNILPNLTLITSIVSNDIINQKNNFSNFMQGLKYTFIYDYIVYDLKNFVKSDKLLDEFNIRYLESDINVYLVYLDYKLDDGDISYKKVYNSCLKTPNISEKVGNFFNDIFRIV